MNMSKLVLQRTFIVSALFLFALVEIGCVVQQNPVSGRNRVFGYSWEQELQLGKQADQEISEHYGVYEDEELDAYITDLGQLLVEHSHMRSEDVHERFRETEFEFRVLDSEVVNAFALPGGYNYVTRGMLAHMENEAQLAMVLGHEIAHVAARHASQRAARQQAGQILLIGGAVAGQELLGLPGQELLELGSAAAQLIFLSYSRSNESEADKLGVEYAAKAGYKSAEGAGFFITMQRLTERAGGGLPNILSSHPDPGDRETKIVEMAAEWEEKGYAQEELGRDRLLDQIDGIIWGRDPRKGFIEDEQFYHPDEAYTFPLPEGWQTHKQADQLLAFSEDEEGAMLFEPTTAESPQEAIEQIIRQDGMQEADMEQDQESEFNAWRGTALVRSEGDMIQLYLYAIEHQGNIYRFLGLADTDKFSDYRPSFQHSSKGFERLTDDRYLEIQPTRVNVVRVEEDQPLRELISDLPHDTDEEQIAIINQMELGDIVESGSRIKLLE